MNPQTENQSSNSESLFDQSGGHYSMIQGQSQDDILTCLTGIQTVHISRIIKSYLCCRDKTVYVHIPTVKGLVPLFEGKEEITCTFGGCGGFSCNSFNLPLIITHNQFQMGPIATLEKECTWPCFFCPRPRIKCTLVNNEYLGLVGDPFKCSPLFCCDIPFCGALNCKCNNNQLISIHNQSDAMLYGIAVNCCTIPMLCKQSICRCPCQELQLNVYPSGFGGMQVASFVKRSTSSCLFGNDYFEVNFPADASNRIKFLLIAAGIYADYAFFDSMNCFPRHEIQ